MTSTFGDTIAAISTPLGEGGIGIVRISGEKSLAIVRSIFTGKLRDRLLSHGYIVDPTTGERVDEVLVAFMAAPHTYTREDVVEIDCHGGPAPLQRVLSLALSLGARAAQPGEFTLRAFVNGRIDLTQAEAVLDMIQARTDAARRLAMSGLEGSLSGPIRKVRATLLEALASLTARIDFPEDDVDTNDTLDPLLESLGILRGLIRNADTGMIYRQGIRAAIVGRPNVGKSSLMNQLLGKDRVIVTPIPGTTRDTVEEVAAIDGIAFVLIDTAGIAESGNLAERISVERSCQAAQQADLVLVVFDLSEPISKADKQIMCLIAERPTLMVANKCDLPARARLDEIGVNEAITTSALSGEGIVQLRSKMLEAVLGGRVTATEIPLVGNPRHRAALERAERNLAQAVTDLRQPMPGDFVTIDLTAALNALGEITGETIEEELLSAIFDKFCIGK